MLFAPLLSFPALADSVRILETDREAVEARVEVALEAKEELLVSAFIFGDDALTMTGLSMLRDAARRGVRIRVLADAMWNKMPDEVVAHLQSEGIEIREFHPVTLRHPSWIFRRLHDKLLIADGARLVTGGRNVQSSYFGFGHQISASNYIDIDLLVEGAAAGEARDYFLELWESDEVRAPRLKKAAVRSDRVSAELDEHKAWLDARVDEARNDPQRAPKPLVDVGAVRFLHDPIARKSEMQKVGAELRELLDGARASVIIESPYLVPTRGLREGLRQAHLRGVKVRILTNSLGSTDNLWPQAGYVGEKANLVRSGVELWEYQGPECLHSKAAVIDEETVIVGSYNLDPRSQNLNREVAVVVRNRDVAVELRQRMDRHLKGARRIDARGYPEGSDEPFPGVPRSKVRTLRFLRLIAPLVRGQL
jgi:putative cardiolipin synthase